CLDASAVDIADAPPPPGQPVREVAKVALIGRQRVRGRAALGRERFEEGADPAGIRAAHPPLAPLSCPGSAPAFDPASGGSLAGGTGSSTSTLRVGGGRSASSA